MKNYDDIFGKDFNQNTYNTLSTTTTNPMLFTPASMADDTFCQQDMDCGANDFLLFDNSLPASGYGFAANSTTTNTQANQPLFGEVSQMQNMNVWAAQTQVQAQATRDFFLFDGDSEMKY